MLSKENRALVESFMEPGCYRPTDTTFGFTDRCLDELLNEARREGIASGSARVFDEMRDGHAL